MGLHSALTRGFIPRIPFSCGSLDPPDKLSITHDTFQVKENEEQGRVGTQSLLKRNLDLLKGCSGMKVKISDFCWLHSFSTAFLLYFSFHKKSPFQFQVDHIEGRRTSNPENQNKWEHRKWLTQTPKGLTRLSILLVPLGRGFPQWPDIIWLPNAKCLVKFISL